MHPHYLARLAQQKFIEHAQLADDAAPLILLALLALVVRMIVGFVLYLHVSGACQVPQMRSFRFAVYILLLISAMTARIDLIQQSRDRCCTPLQDTPA